MRLQKALNLIFVLILSIVLLGGYLYQVVAKEEPCTLCFLQRLAMTAIAVSLLLNLRFGIKAEHYGIAILSAIFGRVVALHQIGLHLYPKITRFGSALFGLEPYVWSFLVFSCSIFVVAVLLIMYGFTKSREQTPTWGNWEKFLFILVAAITFGNLINSLFDCSLLSCP